MGTSCEIIGAKSERRVVAALIVLATALRCIGLNRDPWIDEISSITVASSSDFLYSLRHYDHPPLYFLILRVWMLASERIEWLRSLSIGFSIVTMVALYGWLRHFSARAAILGVMFFGFLPAALSFSQEIRDYPLLMLASAASLLYAEKVVRNPRCTRAVLCLALWLTVCSSTHVLGILMTFSCGLYVIARARRFPMPLTVRGVLPWATPFVVWLFFVASFLLGVSKGDGEWHMPRPSMHLVASVVLELLGIPSVVWPLSALRLSYPVATLVAGPSTFVLFVLLVHHISSGDLRKAVAPLAATLAYVVPVLAYSIVFTPIFVSRTVLPAIVPLCGFLACFVDSIDLRRSRRIVVSILGMFCVSSAIGYSTREAFTSRESWREAFRVVDGSREPIFVSPAWSVDAVKYFVGDKSREVFALDAMSKDDIGTLLGKNAGYLVLYTPSGMDSAAKRIREAVVTSDFAPKERTVVFTRGPISVSRIQG